MTTPGFYSHGSRGPLAYRLSVVSVAKAEGDYSCRLSEMHDMLVYPFRTNDTITQLGLDCTKEVLILSRPRNATFRTS